ncbi:MAG: AAA family ATPase [Rhodothermaceae bacterium]|nr:AAA family ATPase [Rhodothermaceae bacterium]
MLIHPTLSKLEQMRLGGMATALRNQLETPDIEAMSFMDRLGLMVDHEEAVREDRRLARRLKMAKLRLQACMADLDYRPSRGLDKRLMLHLAGCQWIRRRQNILITGLTGVGKSYVACALAHKACLENFRTRYYRLHRLVETLQLAREDRTWLRTLKQLARIDVLLLDDWGLHGIRRAQQRDLMELIDDRYTMRSTIVTSQYPLDKWHQTMEDPTLADAILDRLVNNAHKIQLTGDSMRKIQGEQELTIKSTES